MEHHSESDGHVGVYPREPFRRLRCKSLAHYLRNRVVHFPNLPLTRTSLLSVAEVSATCCSKVGESSDDFGILCGDIGFAGNVGFDIEEKRLV